MVVYLEKNKHNLTMGEIHEQEAHGLNSQMCMTDTIQ